MNPVLVESIRVRMGGQSTEELLALWTTNDRAMWSAEAFEAVKSLLAERGVRELPPQSDPAPLAQAHSPADDPVAQYWLGWLRPLLWVCIAVGVAALPQAVLVLGSLVLPYFPDQWRWRVAAPQWWDGRRSIALWLSVIQIGILPVWLVAASVGCLWLKRWARQALLLYAAISVVLALVSAVMRLLDLQSGLGDVFWTLDLAMAIAPLAEKFVLPVVLWALIRRPEIRSAFVPTFSGRAFEPVPVADSPSASTVP